MLISFVFMKTKIVLAVLIVLLVIGVVFFVRINQQGYQSDDNSPDNLPGNNEDSTTPPANNDNQNTNNNQDSGKIPLAELSQHNLLKDCWIAYDGKVYDITSYLPRHPGSAGAITPYCGSATEFEQAFVNKHGTSKVNMLMKVGTFIGDFDVMGNI
jgi:cytochrome b involved in lipid metabolism